MVGWERQDVLLIDIEHSAAVSEYLVLILFRLKQLVVPQGVTFDRLEGQIGMQVKDLALRDVVVVIKVHSSDNVVLRTGPGVTLYLEHAIFHLHLDVPSHDHQQVTRYVFGNDLDVISVFSAPDKQNHCLFAELNSKVFKLKFLDIPICVLGIKIVHRDSGVFYKGSRIYHEDFIANKRLRHHVLLLYLVVSDPLSEVLCLL